MNTLEAVSKAMVWTEKGTDDKVLIDKLSAAAPPDVSPLHVDDALLVADKPAGLLCVPGRGPDKQDCLATRLQRQFPDACVVHRLDMATSGLWLMARGMPNQRRLSQAFAEREVHKHYEAVVQGELRPSEPRPGGWALIDLPLAADWPNRPRRVVDAELGKPSQTLWRTLEFDRAAGTTRVELRPLTGRTHQLRVHLSAIGHPILGDALYAPPQVLARSPRLLLHATGLALAHPTSGAALAFASRAPF